MNNTCLTRQQFRRLYYTDSMRLWIFSAVCAVVLSALVAGHIEGRMSSCSQTTVTFICLPFALGLYYALRLLFKKAYLLRQIDSQGIVDRAVEDFNSPDTLHIGNPKLYIAAGSEFIFKLSDGTAIPYANISSVKLERNYLPNDGSDPSRHTVTLMVYTNRSKHPIVTGSTRLPMGQITAVADRIKQHRPDIDFSE